MNVRATTGGPGDIRTAVAARTLDDALIVVQGDDRVAWLAGMVTHDVKSLGAGGSCYAAIVHEKGKILADAFVHMREGDIVLALPRDAHAGVMEHFERHIIMEDVTLAVLPDASLISLVGPRARDAMPTDGTNVFAADRIGWGGVDVLVDATRRDALERALAAVPTVDDATWEIARLEAAVPRFGRDFGTDNYVQEANITSRAVSFNKGCYVGQEVVCRLEMRGHVRRQLVSIVIDGAAPEPGTAVEDVGKVTSSAYSEALGASVALAMLKWDVAESRREVRIGDRVARAVDRPIPA